MKSTWRYQDRSEWTFFHWFFEVLNIHPDELDQEAPRHKKTDKVPYSPEWSSHVWVLAHASIPLLLHQYYVHQTGKNIGAIGAFILYHLAFQFIGIHQIQIFRRLGYKYGFLDGDKHVRDRIPDASVSKVLVSLVSTATFRPALMVFLTYYADQAPIMMNWYWLPLEVGLYGIILDFWFYWYHRLMHEMDGLWKFHRTHHLTKHPNPLLTIFADPEQEFFDIVGIPAMTYFTMKLMGMPMGFYEWWICVKYVSYAELAGHCGVRIDGQAPSTLGFLLHYFRSEISIEDHDLHHRNGWRKSYNYGKQTRLWDRVFGTYHERIESAPENIDYSNPAYIPLW